MQPWDVEAVEAKHLQRLTTNERQIEIARTRAIGIERRTIFPPRAGDGAATHHRAHAERDRVAEDLAELLKPGFVAAKGVANDVLPFLSFAEILLVGWL